MTTSLWLLILFVVLCFLSYHRISLLLSSLLLIATLAIMTYSHGLSLGLFLTWVLFVAVLLPLNLKPWRRKYLTSKFFKFYQRIAPTMSQTEQEAIHAGTVTWEAEIFRGNPHWRTLLAMPTAQLSAEEQAFIDGPVETLCQRLNDWEITHQTGDLPDTVWQFLKQQGFFGLIIPKRYGGKEFSAFAHSQIVVKVSGVSVTASTTLSVPNSLGPAELLLNYGTEAQKNYYLPRLASGEEIPCFALTSPEAGSDAGAMIDHGIVCWGEYEGKKILGIRLQWDKRYITLAPVATVIGLAFKLFDPEHLLSEQQERGITCALIPRHTPGISIGRRHFPLYTPFQNGPIQGKDVFVPLDYIIGGAEQIGKGWHMLMECLASGRAITLPSSAVGGAKIACYTAGAYARIRKQFNVSIGQFEGIEALLGRIAGYTYLMDATRQFVLEAIDAGEKPAVASAIVKYHSTELSRNVAIDTMDLHGGKAICLGPHNYIGQGYVSVPIGITVEGANVLTRNMIIFGQGAIRCHPYVLAEMEAAQLPNPKAALKAFDRVIMQHIGFGISNVVRTLFLGLTAAKLVTAPAGKTKHYFQQATRFSSAFALLSDVTMLILGSKLKRKESLSARLGDILSYLYMLSAVLKHYHEQGSPSEDYPVIQFAADFCLYEVQERFNDILKNYPSRPLAMLLRALIFPVGMHFTKPKDSLNHDIALLLMTASATRQRLAAGAYLPTEGEHVMADVQDALIKTIEAEPIEKIIRQAAHDGLIHGYSPQELAQNALQQKIISVVQFDSVSQAEVARKKVIRVDDFAAESFFN